MEIPLDYETLRVIWWGLMGTLLIGFALTDGYDLGVAALMPFIGKTDDERRMAINAIAPHWQGHLCRRIPEQRRAGIHAAGRGRKSGLGAGAG